MTALTMACRYNSLIAHQAQNVGLVKGLPERVAVRRLIPLGMSALVAFGTTLGGYECGLTNELAGCRSGVGGRERRRTIWHLITWGCTEMRIPPCG